jgi:hypothetical protein
MTVSPQAMPGRLRLPHSVLPILLEYSELLGMCENALEAQRLLGRPVRAQPYGLRPAYGARWAARTACVPASACR